MWPALHVLDSKDVAAYLGLLDPGWQKLWRHLRTTLTQSMASGLSKPHLRLAGDIRDCSSQNLHSVQVARARCNDKGKRSLSSALTFVIRRGRTHNHESRMSAKMLGRLLFA